MQVPTTSKHEILYLPEIVTSLTESNMLRGEHFCQPLNLLFTCQSTWDRTWSLSFKSSKKLKNVEPEWRRSEASMRILMQSFEEVVPPILKLDDLQTRHT
ncbi:hypothetical protein KIN20_021616 [Parelaphostrongylus tenuis]|uniref:Uncharacterized protein n=1 Tax=Parelaphostrongylus tenuis TaxID=148309 RepID=A0AAD5MP45_PARTN|nr:hypothetical protein KIN20_021616 [Parelaphostrongylus tenuis]